MMNNEIPLTPSTCIQDHAPGTVFVVDGYTTGMCHVWDWALCHPEYRFIYDIPNRLLGSEWEQHTNLALRLAVSTQDEADRYLPAFVRLPGLLLLRCAPVEEIDVWRYLDDSNQLLHVAIVGQAHFDEVEWLTSIADQCSEAGVPHSLTWREDISPADCGLRGKTINDPIQWEAAK